MYHCDRHGSCRTKKSGSRRVCGKCGVAVEYRPADTMAEAAKISDAWSEAERHKRAGLQYGGHVEIRIVDERQMERNGVE